MKTNSLTYAAFAILTALSISSCTVDDDFSNLESAAIPTSKERTVQDNTSDNKEEIVFSVKSDSETKGDGQLNNLTQFKITAYEEGFNYYDGRTDHVTTSDNGISWTSDCNRYWPSNRPSDWNGLTFYAYTESPINGNPEYNKVSANLDCTYSIPRINNFKVNEDARAQRNLMYAVATEVKYTNQNKEVSLNFKSALSKVNFTAVNNDPNISNIEILSIELGGVKGEGNFQFPDYAALAGKSVVFESDCQGKWILPEDGKAASYKLNDLFLNMGSEGSSNKCTVAENMLLIPQHAEALKDQPSSQGAFIKVTVKITPEGSSTPNAAKDILLPISVDWKEGKAYTYDINWTSNFTIVSCRESNN